MFFFFFVSTLEFSNSSFVLTCTIQYYKLVIHKRVGVTPKKYIYIYIGICKIHSWKEKKREFYHVRVLPSESSKTTTGWGRGGVESDSNFIPAPQPPTPSPDRPE